jgi:hypothetical protein
MTILKKAPEGAEVLDLGAARVARAEARAAEGLGGKFLKISKGYIEVKAEIPVEVAFIFQSGGIKAGLAGILVDPSDADALIADGLTGQDLDAMTSLVSGTSLGESSASPKP